MKKSNKQKLVFKSLRVTVNKDLNKFNDEKYSNKEKMAKAREIIRISGLPEFEDE